jgi:mannose-binding lectin 2
MVNDGTKRYDQDADGQDTELAGCQASFRGKEFPTRARVSYINDVLTVCC